VSSCSPPDTRRSALGGWSRQENGGTAAQASNEAQPSRVRPRVAHVTRAPDEYNKGEREWSRFSFSTKFPQIFEISYFF
jgi:hypothetical protein